MSAKQVKRTPNQRILNQRRIAYFNLIRTKSHNIVSSDAEAKAALTNATNREQRAIAGAIYAKRQLDVRIRVLIGKERISEAEKELDKVHRILRVYGTCTPRVLNAIRSKYRIETH